MSTTPRERGSVATASLADLGFHETDDDRIGSMFPMVARLWRSFATESTETVLYVIAEYSDARASRGYELTVFSTRSALRRPWLWGRVGTFRELPDAYAAARMANEIDNRLLSVRRHRRDITKEDLLGVIRSLDSPKVPTSPYR